MERHLAEARLCSPKGMVKKKKDGEAGSHWLSPDHSQLIAIRG